jgi:predicted amidophosphoribosyltransferase
MNEFEFKIGKCPNCEKVTGGNEKFCEECGQSLNIACPECGEGWRATMFYYRFCPSCGHNMQKTGENKPLPDFDFPEDNRSMVSTEEKINK